MLSKFHHVIMGLTLGYILIINPALSMDQEAKEQATREALERAALFELQEAREQATREALERAALFESQEAKEQALQEALERAALFESQEAKEQATREALERAACQEKQDELDAFNRLPEMVRREKEMSIQDMRDMNIYKVMLFDEMISHVTGYGIKDIRILIAALFHASTQKVFTIPKGYDFEFCSNQVRQRLLSRIEVYPYNSPLTDYPDFKCMGINYGPISINTLCAPVLKSVSVKVNGSGEVERITIVYGEMDKPTAGLVFRAHFDSMIHTPYKVIFDKSMIDWYKTRVWNIMLDEENSVYTNTEFRIIPR